MIEDLGNNRWKIYGEIIYAPNLNTAIKRLLKRKNNLCRSEENWLEKKLKESYDINYGTINC